MPVRLADLAVRFGCELRGDPDALVERVAQLQDAGPGSISFLANPRYRRHLPQTRATAVVIDADSAAECAVNALVATNPYATYARIAQVLYPEESVQGGRHPSAVVEAGAQIDPTAWIGANSFVASGTRVGRRVSVGPGSVVLGNVEIGDDSRLVARVTLCRGVRIGQRCILQPGSVIGADGFGHAPDVDGYVKVPQVGTVVIGNDVEVGSNSTIDRGAIESTVIEDGVKIDNLVQVGHNVRIGAHTVIAACVGISGSTTIGKRCMLGGMVGVAGHLAICDDVALTGRTAVFKSIDRPGAYSGSLWADDAKHFHRNAARFNRLEDLARRVRRLEGGKRAKTGGDDNE
jgi:UDP-3-O-[3-hydroxymyristoyl] glucosamine N-acyltransferase